MAELLSPQALCSDTDAKAAGSIGGTGSKATDDEWIRKVNAASIAFLNLSGREFVSGDATRDVNGDLVIVPSERVFDARELLQVGCEPPELELGDADSIVSVTIDNPDGTTDPLVEGDDWTALPLRRRYAWTPIEALELTGVLAWIRNFTITVEATWGFPAMPEDVREAVARTAASWIVQDVRRYGEVFSADQSTAPPDPGLTHVLPRFAWETAMRYRRSRFG